LPVGKARHSVHFSIFYFSVSALVFPFLISAFLLFEE